MSGLPRSSLSPITAGTTGLPITSRFLLAQRLHSAT
jgi:hypothetical protein